MTSSATRFERGSLRGVVEVDTTSDSECAATGRLDGAALAGCKVEAVFTSRRRLRGLAELSVGGAFEVLGLPGDVDEMWLFWSGECLRVPLTRGN